MVRTSRYRPLLLAGSLLLVVLFVVAGLWLGGVFHGSGEQHFPDIGGNLHLKSLDEPLPVPYNSQPPTSGYHYGGGTAPWGILTQVYSDTLSVHNLEHGGVIIFYRADLDPQQVEQLTGIANKLQQRNPCLILMPRPVTQINAPIALTAWTYLLELETPDEAAITRFFQEHVGRGPEQVCPVGA